MRPLDYYDIGMELANEPSSEIRQRTAVNRLYYGLHHEACCRFFRENPTADPLPRSRRHRELGDRFSKSHDPVSRNIASRLRELSQLRAECDYRLSAGLRYAGMTYQVREVVDLAVRISRDLLDALDRYSPGSASEGCDCPTS